MAIINEARACVTSTLLVARCRLLRIVGGRGTKKVASLLALTVLTLAAMHPAAAAPFVYVSDAGGPSVSVIDTASNTVTATIPVEASLGIAIAPGARVAYVGGFGGTVSVISTLTNAVSATIPVGTSPREFAFTPDGAFAYVTDQAVGVVWVIDTATRTVSGPPIQVGGTPTSIAITPDGTHIYVDILGDVAIIDTSSNLVINTVSVGFSSAGLAITPDGTRAYVANQCGDSLFCNPGTSGTVSVIDVATETVVDSIPIGRSGSQYVAIAPDGIRGYVSNTSDDSVSVIDTQSNVVVGVPIAVGINPQVLAVTPDGRFVYVANRDGTVSVIATDTNSVVATVSVDGSPAFLAITGVCGNSIVDVGEQCDDGNLIDGDGCDINCTFTGCGNGIVTTGEQCDDGNTVNGDCCSSTCQYEPVGSPCPAAEGQSCSVDVCNATGTCTHTACTRTPTETPTDTAGPSPTETSTPALINTATSSWTPSITPTPSPTPLCAASPLPGCRAPGSSRILLKGNNGAKDELVWRWDKGAATDLFALGNPVTGATNYTLCVYGTSGGTAGLILSAFIPAASTCGEGLCWRPSGTHGFQYRDQSGKADGITKVLLHTGTDGEATVKVQAKGPNIPQVVPANGNNLISQDPVATVQLVNSDGECWESVFPAPATKLDGTSFRDKF